MAESAEPKAAITSPVSRTLPVTDVARSADFYRNVLGFEVDDEAVYGPARILFEVKGAATPAMVFFETNDLDRMHAAILAHNGAPSAIEKVNWIKMRMFQVLDPNKHILWFGQSYDQPDSIKSSAMFTRALPNFPVRDVSAAVAYYRDVLGFRINYQQSDLGVMDRDEVTVVLIPQDGRGPASSYFYVEDADALHAELLSKQAKVQGTPTSHPWGLRDFSIKDLDGNELRFGQAFE